MKKKRISQYIYLLGNENFTRLTNENMKMIPLKDIKTQNEVRQLAIEWQKWQSTKVMSYAEISKWRGCFITLAEKFNLLVEEFKENGII